MTLIEPHLSLAEAARRLSPDGRITARSLYTEIRKGRLRSTMVAGKHLVTESDLARMLEACRCQDDARSRPASISASGPDASPSGSSATADTRPALAAALRTVRALKERSRATSPIGTPRRRASASSAG